MTSPPRRLGALPSTSITLSALPALLSPSTLFCNDLPKSLPKPLNLQGTGVAFTTEVPASVQACLTVC